MSRVAIVTDSTAYIPAELVKQLNITVVPLILILGEESFKDGVEMQPEDFYRRMASSKVIPTTSQPTMLSMKNAFEGLLGQGYDVLGIFISSKLSGTVESALQAREMMQKGKDKIAIVDSLATTMAMGWPVLTAARAAEAGENLVECQKLAEKARDQTGVMFVVETLEYLRRGGRIGGAQAMLGTSVEYQADPGIAGRTDCGCGKNPHQAKGACPDARTYGRKKCRPNTGSPGYRFMPMREAEALALLETARKRFNPIESLCSPLSPVIGTHAGPGTISIAIMTGIYKIGFFSWNRGRMNGSCFYFMGLLHGC